MKRSEHRILTTHVGSLVRPKELRELAPAGQEPKDLAQYNAVLCQATMDVVRKQAEVGIDIVSDGEYGKSSWSNYILKRISGFEIRPDQLRPVIWLGRDRERFAEAIFQDFPRLAGGTHTEACVGPIDYQDHAPLDRALANFKAALKQVKVEEAFLTAVAPASTAYDGVNEYYPNEHDYVYAIADALREEYRAIHDAGLLLQVDDAVLANMYDHLVQQSPEKYREWANLRVEALNHALTGIPGGSHSIPRLLRQLARSACRRCAARRNRGLDSQGASRSLLHRGRQCPARTRMANLGEQETAGRQNSHSGRNHSPHRHGGTSAIGGRPHRPLCGVGGARKRDRGQRLRIRAIGYDSARPSDRDVGKVREPGGGRASGLQEVVVIVSYVIALSAFPLAFHSRGSLCETAPAERQPRSRRGDERRSRSVRLLFQKKADVNTPQADGATALEWAAYRDDLELADLLIAAGANPKLPNREGATAIQLASLHGSAAMIEKLLNAGADVNERGVNGETPLMFAARNGNLEALNLLLKRGADVNAKESLRGTTALMWAVEQKHTDAVSLLIEHGADVGVASSPDSKGGTAYLAPTIEQREAARAVHPPAPALSPRLRSCAGSSCLRCCCRGRRCSESLKIPRAAD